VEGSGHGSIQGTIPETCLVGQRELQKAVKLVSVPARVQTGTYRSKTKMLSGKSAHSVIFILTMIERVRFCTNVTVLNLLCAKITVLGALTDDQQTEH
jgi:hypothetical protein